MEEKIKKWFDQGLWTAAMVETAGKKGLITPTQAEAITGVEAITELEAKK